jgi:hypothetical protein
MSETGLSRGPAFVPSFIASLNCPITNLILGNEKGKVVPVLN